MATARNTLAVAIKLDGTAQAKRDLEDVGKAGEQAFARIAAAANKIAPGLGTKLQGALRAIRGQFLALQAAGARFAQSFSTLTTAVNTVGIAAQNTARRIGLITAAVTAAAGVLLLFAKRSAENSERIQNQAQSLGISVEAYQNFESAAKSAGIEQGAFDQILQRFVTNAADAGDAAGDAADKTTKLAQSIRQVEITAEDGSKKLITVRGTSEELAKSITKIGSSSKGSEQDLVAFAKKVTALKTAQERLNAVIDAGFSRRTAAQTVTFLRAIANDADAASRSLSKTLGPLSAVQVAIQVELDNAFDRFGTNLTRIKDQLFTLFSPALTFLVNGFADAIFENEAAILRWANSIANEAIIVVADLFALLRGDDAAVQNKGLIAFRDTLIGIGQTVSQVIFGVVIPAFQQITAAADQVAGVINSIFGTEFTGTGLIVVAVIAQIVGAFTLLLSLLSLGAATVQLLTSTFGLLAVALRPLAFALGFVGAALAGLLGLPAAVGVAIVAAIAIAAAATFVYWEDIKRGAEDAWAHAVLQAEAFANKTAEIFSQETLDTVWQGIKDGARNAFDFASLQAQAFIDTTRALLGSGGDFFGSWLASFQNFFSTVGGLARTFAATLVSTIKSAINSIIASVNTAIAAFRKLFSAQSKAKTSGGGGGGSGFARGGRLHGPGTATSDSIPIWGSAGEFMVRTRAAMKVGYGFLNAVNSGRYDLAGIFDLLRARGFALGGAIGGLSPALAGGLSVDIPRLSLGTIDERSSPVAALQPVTFVLDGERVDGFSASPGAVDELMRASTQKRVRSNSKKPGWYGG